MLSKSKLLDVFIVVVGTLCLSLAVLWVHDPSKFGASMNYRELFDTNVQSRLVKIEFNCAFDWRGQQLSKVHFRDTRAVVYTALPIDRRLMNILLEKHVGFVFCDSFSTGYYFIGWVLLMVFVATFTLMNCTSSLARTSP